MSDSHPEVSNLVGCSVRGPSHEEDGIPCQDSWQGHRLSDSRFVIAVGDGLGSADRSHDGSDVATQEAAEVLREYLADAETIDPDAAREATRSAVKAARQAVAETAAEADYPLSDFNTTLLVAVGGPSGVAGAAVGDGGIVTGRRGEYDLLVPREVTVVDIEYSDMTLPVLSDSWEESYRFGYQEDFDAVAVFSDGVDPWVWDGKASVKPDFFDQVFGHVGSVSDPDTAAEELCAYLNNEHHRKYSRDDKTLAIGTCPDGSDSIRDRIRTGYRLARRLRDHVADSNVLRSADGIDGETIETAAGDLLVVADRLWDEPRGSVYGLCGTDSKSVKVLDAEARFDAETERAVRTLVERSSADQTAETRPVPLVAWPSERVGPVDGGFLGYTFRWGDAAAYPHVLDYAAGAGHAEGGRGILGRLWDAVTFASGPDDKYRLAIDLARAVQTVHELEYGIGDFDHRSIRVGDGTVSVLGCDSFYLSEGSSAPSLSPRYAPPEEVVADLGAVQRADRFGLAVHLFQLLMDGQHPFEARGECAVEGDFDELIRRNPYPYREPRRGVLEPPEDAPSYTALPEGLRTRFETCFVEGKTVPEMRPTANTWVESLEAVNS